MSHHHDFNVVFSENENSDAKNIFPTNRESFHNCNTCQNNANLFLFFFLYHIMHPNAKALMPSMGDTAFTYVFTCMTHVLPSLCQSICVVRNINQLSVGPSDGKI